MREEIIQSAKGDLSRCVMEKGETIATVSDFLGAMAPCKAATMVIEGKDITEAFFELKTGVAGEFLQKVSNYRRRLIILGDFKDRPSRSLRDFIYESNRTGQVVFAETLAAALELLR